MDLMLGPDRELDDAHLPWLRPRRELRKPEKLLPRSVKGP
jgi:hypothetical protein